MEALVVSFTAVMLTFVVRLLTGGPSNTAVVRVCHTHECHEYGRRLSSSLNSSVQPCDSFTNIFTYVYSQLLSAVHCGNLTFRKTGQSAVQRGVALYRSCEDLLHGHRDHLASVREALREAGITWPRRPAEADVLHTVLATSLRLGWDVLFRFVPLQSPRSRLTVNPGRTIVVVFKRKMASQFTRRGREYFSLLRSSMLPHDAIEMDKTSTTIKHRLQEVTALDELTSPLLSAAYNVPTTTPESADHMMDIPKIGLSRARWAAALREFGLDNVTELVTANQEYLLAFLDLWMSLGENSTHVFVSWYTVQDMVKKSVKCSGCGVALKVDPSVEAEEEEAEAKCWQCEVEEKMEKMMVAQSDLLMTIAELEIALATEQEKTRAMGERLKSAEEALAKGNTGAAYGENSREPATRTAAKKDKVAALMANRNLIANFYGGQSRRALSFQVAFCLGLAYAVTGPVIFSRYNRHVPRAAMRQDASHLVLGVCELFWT
ncbi:hypothetical protein HPB51_005594 [Rhipicephalus microplus]|uniref:Uncharacterized protein n=1 Tax=Rhipicephalus microplus TaxID=6941 RepID=A0A9J6DYX8_RHIMP|nr:hypothetical protein HPB51_005594 [Rhipicephalus microplus]